MSPAIENHVYSLLESLGSCGSLLVRDPASSSWRLHSTLRGLLLIFLLSPQAHVQTVGTGFRLTLPEMF